MAIGKLLAPLNGRMVTDDKPYVDDIFDPLFNREVTSYYNKLYGPLGTLPAGYAAMIDNALLGQQGILGPGMGILSTFGRSMDKADDFILGGLTEGVNALGQATGGLNEAPQNPLHRIFVDDYDYQGTKLFAAMGNAMSKLAGTQTPLDESDFTSLGDKVAGMTVDLATDPGVMGSNLYRLNPNTPVGAVGHVLDEYDNLMANVAGNMAFPGGKAMLGRFINKIRDVNKGLGAFNTGPIKDTVIKKANNSAILKDMVNNYVKKYNITLSHPEFKDYEAFLKDLDPNFKSVNDINTETALKKLHKMTDAEILANPVTREHKFLENVINDSLGDLKLKYGLSKDADWQDVLNYITEVGDDYDKNHLIPYLNDIRNTFRLTQQGRRTIANTDIAKPILDEADALIKKGWNDKKVEAFQKKLSSAQDNIVRKEDFLDRIYTTRQQTTILDSNDPTLKALYGHIKHNVDEVNKYSKEPLLKMIAQKTKNGKIELGFKVNTDNLNFIKDMKRVAKKDLQLEDITWHIGKETVYTPEELELMNYFNKLDVSSKKYSKWLGFERKDVGPHLRMLIADDADATKRAMEHYKDIGLDKEQADLLLAELQDANNRILKRGAFGSVDIASNYLGPLKNSPYKYNYNLRAIAASTFTDSYMDNVDVQSMASLMDNPMFTLNKRFDSPNEVREALMAGEGNQNLTLATLKFDDKGQIAGFKRYDKFSDADIDKAFNDPNCILCPEDIVGHLEDSFLSHKRIPPKGIQQISQLYKSSILNNLGFPIGNFGDAFTKQAVEIGRHFGDSAPEAVYNTAESMKNVLDLNNLFDEHVMKGLNEYLASDAAKKDPFFKKYTANKIALTSGTIFNKPELTKMFERYVNNVMPDGRARNLAIFYMDICGDVDLNVGKFRDTTTHVRFNKDLREMESMFSNNPYKTDSWVDTVLYGNKNSAHPIGLINNPLSRFTLGTSENYIEPVARGGTYLNYLKHKGYDFNTILETLGFSGHVNPKKYEEFSNACHEAVNAMYATNFNYESTSKFQKVFAKFVPFPTFYLKNIAFWLDVFDKNPQIVDNTLSIHENLWSGKDTSDKFTAEAKGRGAVPIGQQNTPLTNHLTGLVKSTPYNSMFGAFGAINDPIEDIAFRTNPLMRPLTRHLQQPEDVKYRPYNTNEFQKNIKQNDPEFSNLAYLFHQLNPYDRYINAYMRTPGKVAKKSYQLSDFVPSVFQPDFSKKSR